MKIVIVYAHPYEGSFCHGILEKIKSHIEGRGGEVKVKDLAAMNFDCTVRPEDLLAGRTRQYTPQVKKEQDDIDWADAIVTIAPVWFGMVPGFLKGYFDKVLMSGYGYNPATGDALLRDKRIYSIFTCGMKTPYLELTKQMECINILWDNMFGMCGFRDVVTKFYQGVPAVSHEMRLEYLEDACSFVDSVFDKKPGEDGQIAFAELMFKTYGSMIQEYESLQDYE